MFTSALEHHRTRTAEVISRATGIDSKAAELEVGALTVQLAYLHTEACGWEQNRLLDGQAFAGAPQEDGGPAGLAPAVEALLGFYFGEPDAKDPLVAESQLAFIAMQQISGFSPKREMRARRRSAYQRYADLWEEWAKSRANRTS